jgi:hypothetical protein
MISASIYHFCSRFIIGILTRTFFKSLAVRQCYQAGAAEEPFCTFSSFPNHYFY